MPRSDSWFKPGQSGNPGGRPKTPSARAVLREAMEKPASDDSPRTRLEAWAEDLASTKDPAERLAILKFLEGNQPPAGFSFSVGLTHEEALAELDGEPWVPHKFEVVFVDAPAGSLAKDRRERPDDDARAVEHWLEGQCSQP